MTTNETHSSTSNGSNNSSRQDTATSTFTPLASTMTRRPKVLIIGDINTHSLDFADFSKKFDFAVCIK